MQAPCNAHAQTTTLRSSSSQLPLHMNTIVHTHIDVYLASASPDEVHLPEVIF